MGTMKEEDYYRELESDEFVGPFASIAKAEKAILASHRGIWEESCNCLQRESEMSWRNPVQIFKLTKTVKLKITANIKLSEL